MERAALPFDFQIRKLGFGIIKPDGVEKGLVAYIIEELTKIGIDCYPMPIEVTLEQGCEFYLDKEEPLRSRLGAYLSRGRAVALIMLGDEDMFNLANLKNGPTDPFFAPDGTFRSYSLDSIAKADVEKRAAENIFHLARTPEEVQSNVNWFYRYFGNIPELRERFPEYLTLIYL